jgi:hypothetical protein
MLVSCFVGRNSCLGFEFCAGSASQPPLHNAGRARRIARFDARSKPFLPGADRPHFPVVDQDEGQAFVVVSSGGAPGAAVQILGAEDCILNEYVAIDLNLDRRRFDDCLGHWGAAP